MDEIEEIRKRHRIAHDGFEFFRANGFKDRSAIANLVRAFDDIPRLLELLEEKHDPPEGNQGSV